MRVIRYLSTFKPAMPTAVTIGNFDGLHRGHQAILAELKSLSEQNQLTSTVVLFEPQPFEFFMPDEAPARLLTLADKLEILEDLGIQQVVIIDFNEKIAMQTPEDFVEKVLLKQLKTKLLLVGQDFRFGAKRAGDVSFLQRYEDQLDLIIVNDICHEDQRYSSTAVRDALKQGDCALAAELLGRPYTMQGVVVHGQQLGRKLGCPTANIEPNRLHCALRGIFVTRVYGVGKKTWAGAASIGLRPAVNGDTELLEVHLLDFNRDIYGETLRIEFLHKLRDEADFHSLDDLKAQMARDIEQTREYFKHGGL